MHYRIRKIRHDRRMRRLGWFARFRRNERGVQTRRVRDRSADHADDVWRGR